MHEGNDTGSTHILVADDDPGVRYVVRWALEGDGHSVKTAANGEEAMDSIQEASPKLLLLDLTMPSGTGAEVARRAHAVRADTPILLITGDGRAREKAKLVGAYEYLEKPFEVGDLLAAVRRGLEVAVS